MPNTKKPFDKANQAGKPVITATPMLRSMVESPRPTRAEVPDEANAILNGSDALMLSEEIANGKHPVRSVQMKVRIAKIVEDGFPNRTWSHKWNSNQVRGLSKAVVLAACELAENICAKVFINFIQSGSTSP